MEGSKNESLGIERAKGWAKRVIKWTWNIVSTLSTIVVVAICTLGFIGYKTQTTANEYGQAYVERVFPKVATFDSDTMRYIVAPDLRQSMETPEGQEHLQHYLYTLGEFVSMGEITMEDIDLPDSSSPGYVKYTFPARFEDMEVKATVVLKMDGSHKSFKVSDFMLTDE